MKEFNWTDMSGSATRAAMKLSASSTTTHHWPVAANMAASEALRLKSTPVRDSIGPKQTTADHKKTNAPTAHPRQLNELRSSARAKLQASPVRPLRVSQIIAMFLWPIISGLLFSSAQYSSPLQKLVTTTGHSAAALAAHLCDTSRLLRCQQDLARDLQPSGQYAAAQGPPYSPAVQLREQHQLIGSVGACRLVRSNLDCILATTPACYEAGLQAAHSTADLALRSKRFLEQQNCNEPDTSWQSTFCFRSPEMRNCEERYGFTVYASSALTMANATSCLAYQAFKYCVETHLRLSCKVHEIDMTNEYLIERAGDLAWRCPPANLSSSPFGQHYGHSIRSPYGLSNPSGAIVSPSSSYNSQYEQRPIYTGSSSGNGLNLFTGVGGVREQAWEQFMNPYDDTRFRGAHLPTIGGGEVLGRLVAGAGFEAELSDCPMKAAPYARECEDTLIEQQRLARDSRDGNELQRRICCSLFQFRDCISRVVLDRCADSTPAAVEILMGVRRREMVLTCRGYNRDLCSGALAGALVNPLLVIAASILAAFMTFKQQVSI